MITLTANSRFASYKSDDMVTTGSVGIPVTVILSEDYSGLSTIIVFRGSGETIDVALVGTSCVVPHECLASPGGLLQIGVYARNGEGTIVIPTVWAGSLPIVQGVAPSDVDPAEPTPDWTAQVQALATQASEDATTALNKATSVEEAAARGDFDGTDGVTPEIFTNAVTLNPGSSAYANTSGTVEQPLITFGIPRGADGTDGTDGTDGFSPTITVTDITGGHRLTITDINGTQTVDVMDGQGGGGGAVSSVNGQTGDVVLDAEDVGAGTYSKPSGGIPKTDLASSVQTSLGKADTALQSAPVSSVNGQTGAVNLSIPSSASDVGAVAVAQGAGHAGEFLVVGSDGNVTTVTLATWQGGSY